MNRWLILSLVVIAGVALALRYPRLDERPMHNDEAVNAIKFGQLWEQGEYKYDPNEHHGPTLFYATLAVARLTSSPDFEHLTETKLRLIPVVFGVGLILLLPLMGDGLGRNAAIWAAIFTATSPAFIYYSRYYIHEMLLVFFTCLALAAGWRYWQSRKLSWSLLAGAGLGMMHATKETFVITLAAAGLAIVLNQIWNRWLDASVPPIPARGLKVWHVAAAFGVWCVVAVVLFTSFFANASGPLDSVRTYAPWLSRAGGESPHIHSSSFYLQRLLWFHNAKGPLWTEALLLALGLIGAASSFLRKNLGSTSASFGRFLALYTFLLTAAYSLIAYKTPWCLLSFWHGMILLAGLGAAALLRSARHLGSRLAWTAFLLVGTAHLGWQAIQAAIPFAADQRNPYVYAQTSPDILLLVRQLGSLAEVHPEGHRMLVKVIAPEADYWPLPWYLRRFKNVGWWDQLPTDPWAPVMLVSSRFHAALDEKKTHLMVGYFSLRPQVFFELYVQADLWRAYLAKHPPKPQAE